LLPFSVYQQLGLGDLRHAQGEITDVLIHVGEFIYLMDFIVLETQSVLNLKVQTPVILGLPFLATTNIIINCRNRSMRLTFGDITKEVNVFHLGKQPRYFDDQTFEVNLKVGLTSEQEEELEYESEHEFDLGLDDFKLDQIVDSAVEWATNATPINLFQ